MLVSNDDYLSLARQLLPATLHAGAAIMRHFHEGVAVETKSDHSPVTAADQEAEDIILAALSKAAPSVPVVAEESASRGDIPAVDNILFLVDPLDGTRGFIKQRPEFTVNIALAIDGKAKFGIVYAPALRQLFVTLGADHAVEITAPAEPVDDVLARFEQRRLHARFADRPKLRIASSRYMSKRFDARLATLPEHERVRVDSSIKFCMVARGDADIYPRLGEINEWDSAAGAAVLTAAGGCVTDTTGTPIRYGNAARRFLHGAFIAWASPEPTDLIAAFQSP